MILIPVVVNSTENMLNLVPNSIREAIKVLASKGLVEVRRKTGTRVRPVKDWNSLDPDVISWKFSDESGILGAIEI